MVAPESDNREWDELTSALQDYGILHVRPGRRTRTRLPSAAPLFRRLAGARAVRLQEASILLLLTHPHLAAAAREAIEGLAGPERDRAMRRYVAAAALQRLWRTRIETEIGRQPLIEPAYLDQLGLPSLDEDFGRRTLYELSRQEESLYGYNAWAGYTSLMELFLGEIRLSGWGKMRARAG
ncbi:MAG: hypothetical protein HYY04_03910 [Chloroflexi bacterium]|nr:hypothetical protein [Chloroflexota bacterium]